jgi:hypothetical protein
MRDPDVERAIPVLEREGLLSGPAALAAGRLARGELVSARGILRGALYAGVLLLVGGVSWFLKENYRAIGPIGIAVLVGLAGLASLAWVFRRAPAFTWGEAPVAAESGWALDYGLLLGALLLAADLAFVERQFALLGDAWPWHLLVVAIGYAALSLRFDSRLMFSLALSSFAAWRGVSLGISKWNVWFASTTDRLRWNVLVCAVAFAILGWSMRRWGRKAHFEPAATYLGCALGLLSLMSGLGTPADTAWALALLACGSALAVVSFRVRRLPLFTMAVLGAYVGLAFLGADALDEELLGFAWVFLTSGLVLAAIVWARRSLRGASP